MEEIKVSEEMVEDYIFNNPESIEFGREDGEYAVYRQFRLKPYGIIDLLFISTDEAIDLYPIEIKATPLKYEDLGQVCKYMVGLKKLYYSKFPDITCNIKPTLVTRKPNSDSDLVFLLSCLKNINFYHFDISLENGIQIENVYHDWFQNGKYSKSTIKKLAKHNQRHIKHIFNYFSHFSDHGPTELKDRCSYFGKREWMSMPRRYRYEIVQQWKNYGFDVSKFMNKNAEDAPF